MPATKSGPTPHSGPGLCRITEAAVELHETVGPARTTVSAIAEKAGVQRHTYYAHFPELKNLYQACMGHYMERNPVPDPSRWAQVPEPEERLRVALSEVYAYSTLATRRCCQTYCATHH
jgi:AcrR family transcriptional regulator